MTRSPGPDAGQLTVMSQPLNTIHATMFYTEGQTTAVLVDRGGRRGRRRRFATAEAALGWCRAHATAFVWLPTGPDPTAN